MDDNILLHNALVVVTPGEEGHVLSAPVPEPLESVLKGYTAGKALRIKAGELFTL